MIWMGIPGEYYSEQKQQQLGLAENREVGDKVLDWNFEVSPMYSGVLLVKEKPSRGWYTNADRQLGLPRADWDHSCVQRGELGLLSDWRRLDLRQPSWMVHKSI